MCRTRTRETVRDLLQPLNCGNRNHDNGHNATGACGLRCYGGPAAGRRTSGSLSLVRGVLPPVHVDNPEAVITMTPAGRTRSASTATALRQHGLRPEDIARLREEQDGRCYLCGGLLPRGGYAVAIDHDHRCCPSRQSCSYCRRGLACQSCNVLIGHARDDPRLLRQIADNLEAAIADVTRRLASKPEQASLVEASSIAAAPRVTRSSPKAKAKRRPMPTGNSRDVLGDVLVVFDGFKGAKGLHWRTIADRLAAKFPDRWAGATKEVVSAQVRALGVRGVNVRCRTPEGSRVLWGCHRADVEAAVASREFWAAS